MRLTNILLTLSLLTLCTTFNFNKLKQKEITKIKKYCGLPKTKPKSHFKVIGKEAKIEDYPWSVKLEVEILLTEHHPHQKTKTDRGRAPCSGVLISQRHILTAAHCLYDQEIWYKNNNKDIENIEYKNRNPRDMIAHLGGTTKDYQVKGYYAEPTKDNKESLLFYDFAILELRKDLSAKKIKQGIYRPICFTDTHAAFDQIDTTVAGYGGKSGKLNAAKTERVRCPAGKHSPLAKCFRQKTEKGDSGTAYFKFDKSGRAQLTDLCVGDTSGVGRAINAVLNHKQSPLNVTKREINLNYVMK